MNKEFNELELGDVIWATEPNLGSHIYILCNNITDEKIDCVTAVTISSNCNQCIDCCIELESVPEEWFKITKSKSFVRIEEPRCINASNYQKKHYSFKGNISQYPELYKNICQKYHTIVQNVCGCN